MPETSLAEKFHHAKALYRFFTHRCDPLQLFDQPNDQELLQAFVELCINDLHLQLHDVLMLHDDELRCIFDKKSYTIEQRVILRRYLNLPENAILLLWMTVKVGGAMLLMATYRIGRAFASLQGVTALTVGVGVAMLGQKALREKLEQCFFGLGNHVSRSRGGPTSSFAYNRNGRGGRNAAAAGDGRQVFRREEDFVEVNCSSSI